MRTDRSRPQIGHPSQMSPSMFMARCCEDTAFDLRKSVIISEARADFVQEITSLRLIRPWLATWRNTA
jgi:hypothetical protein